jgi:hypothetical protein
MATVMALGVSSISQSADHQRLYAKELVMPAFQQATLTKDAPITDVRFSSPTTLLMIGQTSIWRWDLASAKLLRTQIVNTSEGSGNSLRHMGSDGLSDFVASDSKLFQISWSPGRVLQFDIGQQDNTLGFAGEGDNYWLIKARHLLRIDRYSKSVIDRYQYDLPESIKAVFDPLRQRLWYLTKREVRFIDFHDSNSESHVSARLKSTGIDLQITTHELVALTQSGVLRLNFAGKQLQLIPVEGRRKIRNMSISEAYHAYLFDDQYLEIYNVPTKSTSVAQIPSAFTQPADAMHFNRDFVALLVAGTPRVFSLSPDKPGD